MPQRFHDHLGDLLVSMRLLTRAQADSIRQQQRRTGLSFGALAEVLHGIGPRAIRLAWSHLESEPANWIDLDRHPVDVRTLEMLSRRQAGQFLMLPLGREDGFLKAATIEANFRRCVNFGFRVLGKALQVKIADRDQLVEHLGRHYRWPGIESRALTSARRPTCQCVVGAKGERRPCV